MNFEATITAKPKIKAGPSPSAKDDNKKTTANANFFRERQIRKGKATADPSGMTTIKTTAKAEAIAAVVRHCRV